MESNQIKPKEIYKYGFIGELSLNGRLRPCTGVLPMVMAAKEANIKNIIVPIENIREASLVNGVNVYGFSRLKEVADFLEEKKPYQVPMTEGEYLEDINPFSIDFRDVQGQDAMIEYIV